jgi:hypothetical protein
VIVVLFKERKGRLNFGGNQPLEKCMSDSIDVLLGVTLIPAAFRCCMFLNVIGVFDVSMLPLDVVCS